MLKSRAPEIAVFPGGAADTTPAAAGAALQAEVGAVLGKSPVGGGWFEPPEGRGGGWREGDVAAGDPHPPHLQRSGARIKTSAATPPGVSFLERVWAELPTLRAVLLPSRSVEGAGAAAGDGSHCFSLISQVDTELESLGCGPRPPQHSETPTAEPQNAGPGCWTGLRGEREKRASNQLLLCRKKAKGENITK